MKLKITPARFQKKLWVFTVAVCLGGWAAGTHADPVGSPAGALDAGRPTLNPFQPDPTSDLTKPSNKQESLPMAEPDGKEKAKSLKLPGLPAEAPIPEGDKTPRLTLKKVEFEGNEAIPTAELDEVAKPYINRRLTSAELEGLRYQLSLYYVNKGFVSSGAAIEKQTVTDGVVKIKLIEGKLTEVRVTDMTAEASKDDWFGRLWSLRESYISNRLMGDEEQPLNTQELQERYVKLLNDPLIERLNGSLMPGLHPGDAVLDLKVVRNRPYGVSLGADNFSPPSVGGYAGRMGAWIANLSGFGERIDFNFNATGGSNTYNASIDIPLNSLGTRFAFHYTNSLNDLIEPPFATLNIHSNVISYDGQLSHPWFWDQLRQKLTGAVNFNVRQDMTTIAGRPFNRPGAVDGQTQETVVRAWLDYLYLHKDFDLDLRSTFSVGVNALGATITNQNVGDGRFFDWLGQGILRYRPARLFPPGTYVSLSGAVQLSDDRLLPLEKMAIGGVYTVRGYRQNYLVRDEGFYAALELYFPILGRESANKRGLFLVPFFNYGGAWDYGGKANYVSSAGVGLEGHYDGFSAQLFWAQRLDTYIIPQGTPYDLQDNGITFRVNWQSF